MKKTSHDNPVRVLIFDDDADILEICRYILESKGYQVQTRQNCTGVLSEMKAFNPQVVIMDNWIPDIGGVQATQLIKKDPEFQHVPVILFSASKDLKTLVVEAKADAFIEKPFNIEQLEQMVKSLVKN